MINYGSKFCFLFICLKILLSVLNLNFMKAYKSAVFSRNEESVHITKKQIINLSLYTNYFAVNLGFSMS